MDSYSTTLAVECGILEPSDHNKSFLRFGGVPCDATRAYVGDLTDWGPVVEVLVNEDEKTQVVQIGKWDDPRLFGVKIIMVELIPDSGQKKGVVLNEEMYVEGKKCMVNGKPYFMGEILKIIPWEKVAEKNRPRMGLGVWMAVHGAKDIIECVV